MNVVLPLLHAAHIGINKTYELCRSLYIWPGMYNDLKQMIAQCKPCNMYKRSQLKNPISTQPPSAYLGLPMSHIGLDLFDFGGKQHLICVDHWSGYPMFSTLSYTKSSAVIGTLKAWFNLLGWPQSIRSDSRPQFLSEFVKFCKDNSICHELSAPYNPRSNGLAESVANVVTFTLIKCLGRKETYREGSTSGGMLHTPAWLFSRSADVRQTPEHSALTARQSFCSYRLTGGSCGQR